MTLILASSLNTNYKDEDGNRVPIRMADTNLIVTNIKKHTPKRENVVFVANDPQDFEKVDAIKECYARAFELSGMKFANSIGLDNRNKSDASQVLKNADLIVLIGGKLMCQLDFFKEINLKEVLRGHRGLVIGVSAGSMSMCERVLNFPESADDLNNGEARILKGLGFHDEIIVPHFNGETGTYLEGLCDIDVVREILILSKNQSFIAYDDNSYILINDEGAKYYGDFYNICDGAIKKISENNLR